jgi:predicted TIM-barrel fold metal-dependent hydrolase
MSELSRRRLLGLISTIALPFAGGCAHEIAPICPGSPEISDTKSSLTVDVHAHIFNGSDLQIKEFISQVVVAHKDSELYDLAQVMGGLLQKLSWHIAPDAKKENTVLQSYQKNLQDCTAEDSLRLVASRAFEEGYQLGVAQLRAAKTSLASSPSEASVLAPSTHIQGNGIGDAIDLLPPTFEQYQQERSTAVSVLGGKPTAHGYIDFVLHHFNYRHVNALDYLRTYSKASPRKIDLLVACMVDYDYWLARGKSTPTSLEEQVELMARICEITQGRVHGFVPFCPFRELVTSDGKSAGDSMRLVKHAIEKQGFMGVKLYPPMGFAPWGNTDLSCWANKTTLLPEAKDAKFGERLDVAMERLFEWCIQKEVPVMAHANLSNSPYDDFKKLAGAEYWDKALDKFKTLTVDFGHFGDTDIENHDGAISKEFIELMKDASTASGYGAFADTAYFAGILTDPVGIQKVLLQLYGDSHSHILSDRLMYGTDWTMILPQARVDKYLAQFIDVIDKLSKEHPSLNPSSTTLTEAFFGRNAVRYLGLGATKKNRHRIEEFYAGRKIATPDWMKKVT